MAELFGTNVADYTEYSSHRVDSMIVVVVDVILGKSPSVTLLPALAASRVVEVHFSVRLIRDLQCLAS